MATYKGVNAWAEAQKKKLTELDKAFGRTVATIHADQMVRIFQEGERQSGGKIGAYNTTKPLYVNPKLVPKKFAPKGKDGEVKFKNGKPHKTGYFNNYKDFRQSQNRQVGFVDLKLSGQLQSDITNSLQKQGDTWIAGTKNPANTAKLEGAIDKYGADVFKLSKEEREKLVDILTKERLEIGI